MDTDQAFAARIRDRYPEGLTGVVPIGGTRTTYILEQNRQQNSPGRINDFADYASQFLKRYLDFAAMFLDLGGQNIVMPVLSYQSFSERGQEYTEFVAQSGLMLINESSNKFYEDLNVDPYFAGIDTLLHLPESHPGHHLGSELKAFQQQWPYQTGRRKVIWEIAPIPLFSFFKAQQVMGEEASAELEAALAATSDMDVMYKLLFKFYSRSAYGTEIPIPHFYLGTNRNGQMHLRSLLPIAMLCGGPFRLFYIPYPHLFTQRETLKAILEDLAFGKPTLRTSEKDYGEKYTSELAEAEYQRFLDLSANADSVVGLTRSAPKDGDDM